MTHDPLGLIDTLKAENEWLRDELAYQTQNAADAHQKRADQFRRAADALEALREVEHVLGPNSVHGTSINAARAAREIVRRALSIE